MVSFRHDFFGDVFHQLFFYGQWGSTALGYQSDAVAHPENVCVYCHGSLVEYHALNHIRRLSTHAGQLGQLFQGAGYFTSEVLDQHLRHSHQMLSLVVRVTHAFDVLENHLRCSGSQSFRCWKVVEEGRGDLVDPLVGALCTEDNRYQ